jgi:hypothetical protein
MTKPALANALPIPDFKVPADGWMEAAPLGESRGSVRSPDGTRRPVIQVIDDKAAAAMIANFKANDAAIGLVLDVDHRIIFHGAGAAAGWIIALKVAPRKGAVGNALWCQIRPSEMGKAAIEGGDYRFLSICADPAECEDLGNGRIRPLRLNSISLTNNPNLPVEAITNSAVGALPAAITTTTEESKHMDQLKQLLGLAPTATDADVRAAVTALQGERTAAIADATAAKAALANAQAQQAEVIANADIVEFSAIIEPMKAEDKAAVKAGLLANRAATRAALVAVKGQAAALAEPDPSKNMLPNGKKPEPVLANSAEAFGAEFDKDAKLQDEFKGAGGKAAFVALRQAELAKNPSK